MAGVLRQQTGLTLVELLITILIIGILAAIGLGAYNGQRNKAYNADAKTAERTAVTAAVTYYTDRETFDGFTVQVLNELESSLADSEPAGTLLRSPNADPSRIYVANGRTGDPSGDAQGFGADPYIGDFHSGNRLVLCAASRGDNGFCARVDYRFSPPVTYAEGIPTHPARDSLREISAYGSFSASGWN